MATAVDLDAYVEGVRAGDRALLARAITLVESQRRDHAEQAQELLTRLLPHSGGARRIGISGVPGAGKSTTIDTLGTHLTGRGHRVAVLAVDPSSTRTGGSILGDRTRMRRLSGDPDAFVRPSPAAGTLGGVARRTRETILVMEAAGFDIVIVETVGVGQSEAAVAQMVDCFVLLTLAGAGDQLQGIKRGVLELADVVAVNKADGPRAEEAERARRELRRALRMLRAGPDDTPPRVCTCSGLTGDGVAELWEHVTARLAELEDSGRLRERRERQRVDWMWSQVADEVLAAVYRAPAVRERSPALEDAVRSGTLTPSEAARRILRRLDGIPLIEPDG